MTAVWSWLKRNLVVVAGLGTLVYMLAPNVVVVAFSFNKPKGRYNYEWSSFSTDAWTDPCGVAGMCDSVTLSLKIAVLATLGATVLGTLAAFALARYRFRARGPVNSLIFLPMAMPEIVMAASIGMLFLGMGMDAGFTTILIAHITFCVSFVITAVKARVLGMDANVEEAARDLYASPVQVFLRVTLPLAAPGIAAGAMLAFALSFDDFIITNFNAGPDTVTFPMFVWGASQRGTPPQINVIGSAMLIVSVLAVLAAQLVGRRGRGRTKA
ncbi:ABC transporter permease [Yinghuangia aomiensis]|uniref:ABC transporter permease n=2 Tax=Yinghuangia aomiensis TaxID=676205 RepID=A0ABP9GPI9_9ACTN